MGDTPENDKFLKGLLAAFGIVVTLMGGWTVYTQSNRFTHRDGERQAKRIERIEASDLRMSEAMETQRMKLDEKYDQIVRQLARIEGSLNYVRYFARKGQRSEDEPKRGVKFD